MRVFTPSRQGKELASRPELFLFSNYTATPLIQPCFSTPADDSLPSPPFGNGWVANRFNPTYPPRLSFVGFREANRSKEVAVPFQLLSRGGGGEERGGIDIKR